MKQNFAILGTNLKRAELLNINTDIIITGLNADQAREKYKALRNLNNLDSVSIVQLVEHNKQPLSGEIKYLYFDSMEYTADDSVLLTDFDVKCGLIIESTDYC